MSGLSGSKSEFLYKRAKDLMPGGVSSPVRAFSPYPFFVSRSGGSRIVDVDGKEYVDYCLAYGPLILGHSPPDVMSAVKEQLDKGTMYGCPTEAEVELAELVCDSVPCVDMVRLVNTGTEATMSAIRAARGFTQKRKIVKFEGCYHGAHDCVLVKAGSGATTLGMPDSLGVPEDSTRNTLVIPFNDFDAVENLVSTNDDVAAVIIEPVIGNAGVIPPKKGYLHQIRELTKRHGIVLIFDEVITGFRLAFGGAQEYYDVVPDMVTLGKIMGGGFPIGAYGGRKEIMEMIAPTGKVYQAGTYSGNPVSVAAGLGTLRHIQGQGDSFYQDLRERADRMCDAIQDTIGDYGFSFQINKVASMFQIFFTKDPVRDYATAKKADRERFALFFHELLRHGVFIPPSQFETCFLSSAHTDEDIEKTLDAYNHAFKAAKATFGN